MSQRRQWSFWLVLFLLMVVGARAIQDAQQRKDETSREYSQLLADVQQNKIESIAVRENGRLLIVRERGADRDVRIFGPGSLEVINDNIEAARPEDSDLVVAYPPPSLLREFGRQLIGFLPIALLVIIIYIVFIRHMAAGNNQAMSFSRSRHRRLTDGSPRKTFDDVAGVDEAKEELAEVVDFLRHADRYKKMGAEIPKGILLMGPPGCGKTLLARAVAGEAEVPFFHISGSDFVEMFVGVGASRVRDLFEQAKANRPCIVFIDELDAVGRQRGAGLGGGHDEREQTVNQMLVEMDGFEPNNGIIVMAATNRPDILDPALLRPGRFDRRVLVDAPDQKGRQEILDLYLKARPVADEVDSSILARQTPGLTGADLYSLVNEASILAARLQRDKILMPDFEEALERVLAGRQRKSRLLQPDERRLTAYHEAGHALVAHFHPDCEPVHKISILPRGRALGYVVSLPTEERFNRTLKELKALLAQALGGRVAEEMVYGHEGITTGAENDLNKVTELARDMVCEYGMSDQVGLRTLGRKHGPVFLGRDIAEERNYSDEMAHLIDKEIRRLIEGAHEQARSILEAHRREMDQLVEVLLEREMLSGSELTEILGPRDPRYLDNELNGNGGLIDSEHDTP